MWRLGDLRIGGRTVLGPMSGFTSAAYRDFMKPFGAAVCVTEMVSAQGVIHGHSRTAAYLGFGRNYPTGLQLFGHDPEILAQAAAAAVKMNPNIDFIDINMGCPVPKVVRNGAGSVLIKDPAKCGEIVRRVKAAVDIPVTAKIRLGWTPATVNFREVIAELTAAGVDAVAVHVRTRDQRYAGEPRYDLVPGLQQEMSVPLIISGNIYTVADAVRAVGITGAAAVMVARGGVGDPFLLTQIERYFHDGTVLPNPTVRKQTEWCLELADMILAEQGEDAGVRRLRTLAPHFVAGCRRSREYRNRLATETDSRADLAALLNEISAEDGGERIYTEGRPDLAAEVRKARTVRSSQTALVLSRSDGPTRCGLSVPGQCGLRSRRCGHDAGRAV
ncbi:MAG: tRNA-dihydrouridine synthase, partial [Candidatus Methanomethylophilus sp.]|nr:tRNA-dihydrouridine synthase [Methanomethylophilus sp.]